MKKVIIDERWDFNFFPAKTQDRKELNVRHGSHCRLFLFLSHKFVGVFTPRGLLGSHVCDINDMTPF